MKILFKIWPDTPKQFVDDLRALVMRNLAPDSTAAFCRIIELEPRLTTQHLRELNDYLARVLDDRIYKEGKENARL